MKPTLNSPPFQLLTVLELYCHISRTEFCNQNIASRYMMAVPRSEYLSNIWADGIFGEHPLKLSQTP